MRRILLAIVLVLLLAAAFWLPGFHRQVHMGAGYLAKQMCSCVFVAERSIASCRSDMLPQMDRIELEPLAQGQGIRAFVPVLAERIARFEEGFGCTLAP